MSVRPYPEEFAPCGVPAALTHLPVGFHREVHDLADCLVSRPKPFRIVIWEPLRTKAPAPPKAQAFCCYINTVIFYHFPYIVSPWAKPFRLDSGRLCWSKPGGFVEWDQIRTRLRWDDIVTFDDEPFTIGGGTVLWKRRRWWMLRHARRVEQ